MQHPTAYIARRSLQQPIYAVSDSIYRQQITAAMENLLGEQPSKQGQQVPAQPGGTRPAPTAEQLAEFASSHHQTGRKCGAPEAFAVEGEAPARRTQAPQLTGVYNHRLVATTLAG